MKVASSEFVFTSITIQSPKLSYIYIKKNYLKSSNNLYSRLSLSRTPSTTNLSLSRTKVSVPLCRLQPIFLSLSRTLSISNKFSGPLRVRDREIQLYFYIRCTEGRDIPTVVNRNLLSVAWYVASSVASKINHQMQSLHLRILMRETYFSIERYVSTHIPRSAC